jgi:hypothetical protein
MVYFLVNIIKWNLKKSGEFKEWREVWGWLA